MHSPVNEISNKINEIITLNIFWDINYSGNKIISKEPKVETDIQAAIHALLSDQMFMSNIEVVPEFTTGVGRLDFLLLASLATGEIYKVFVEFKHAHSKKLFKGLTEQLPAYMANKNVNSGIYIILWFGKGPTKDIYSMESLAERIIAAQFEANLKYHKNIRVFFIDFTKNKTASKL